MARPATLSLSIDLLRFSLAHRMGEGRGEGGLAATSGHKDPSTTPLRTPSTSPLVDWVDLLGQTAPAIEPKPDGTAVLNLPPGAAYCLSSTAVPRGMRGEE